MGGTGCGCGCGSVLVRGKKVQQRLGERGSDVAETVTYIYLFYSDVVMSLRDW